MSVKWVRNKRWDDEHLRGGLLPLKWLLRAFSSITMAVVLLVLLVLYGVMASIPIGLLAMAPTYLVYALSVALAIGVAGVLPAWVLNRALAARSVRFGTRVATAILVVGAGGTLGVWAWASWAAPMMAFDPQTGRGVRFFADFVERYKGEPLRRLPGVEMSELEFYAWWPLNTLLYLFVLNMVVATVRRIEFKFENLGVLTVHTGIVVLALGSAYYSLQKQEGDVRLVANVDPSTGVPLGSGPQATGFFDNTKSVLVVQQKATREMIDAGHFPRAEQRLLEGLPRYNAHGVSSGPVRIENADDPDVGDAGRTLSIEPAPMPPPPRADGTPGVANVDPDIRVRVIGFAPYANTGSASLVIEPGREPEVVLRERARSFDLVRLETTGADARVTQEDAALSFPLVPGSPSGRWRLLGDGAQAALGVEYTRAMDERRWAALTAPVPAGTSYALSVRLNETPDSPGVSLKPVRIEPGTEVRVGDSGWTLRVREIQSRNAMAFLTPGYEEARTSVAVVEVRQPARDGRPERTFTRYVHHRFPERDQDILDERLGDGRPKRIDADPVIELSLIDASGVQVYVDEVVAPTSAPSASTFRVAVRLPGGQVRTFEGLNAGAVVTIVPGAGVRIGPEIGLVDAPELVNESEQQKSLIGTRKMAMVAIEVRSDKHPNWRRVRWVRHQDYLGAQEQFAPFDLPDGRQVRVAVGRLYHEFPGGMALALRDFAMIPYEHSDVPRDYRSDVEVVRGLGTPQERREVSRTSLNAPLLASPFFWDESRAWALNALGWLGASVGPTQYKLSQNAWDPEMWRSSKAQVEAGTLQRPFVRFTILGVGNNPGYSIIFLGGILISAGIPWAFYVKPWLVRRRSAKLRAQHQGGRSVEVASGAGAPAGVAS